MGRWYLVRHGETDWNRTGRIQGHSDVPLSERGANQMKMLAERLADLSFSAVYTSDLSRAIESAETIAGTSGVENQVEPELREFSYGEWEGLTIEEVETQYPGSLAERVGLGDNAFSAPGGEDTAQVLERVKRFATKAAECHAPEDDILIVAHGGSIRALVVCLMGLPDDHFWRFQVDCGSLSIVSIHSESCVLELWNDTGHLSVTV